MKIKVVNNRAFILSVEDTEFVLNMYIKPNYPYHKFYVKKSSSTDSIYIFITRNGLRKVVRLSNHPNTHNKYHYISPNTRIHKIVAIVVNSIAELENSHLDKILNNLN